jgi:parallel beta-helix repeat protein
LTVNWSITSGQLSGTAQTERQWNPVDSVGEDVLTVTVSDGELSDDVVATIKRGTRSTSADLGPFTFTQAKSPWIIDPPVGTIRWSNNIEIEPGTEMYINNEDLLIEVVGLLQSVGTKTDTILVQPNDRTIRCGDERPWWKGFQLVADGLAAGQVEMAYTHVSYGERSLYVWQGDSSARLRYCRFVCGGEAGIKMGSSGVLVVDNCEVSDNKTYGIYVSSSTVPDSVTITNNLIKSNDHTGIAMNFKDETKAAVITIERNDIKLNSVYGITMTNAMWPTIQHNNLSLNNLSNISNIVLLDPFPNVSGSLADWDTLWATDNYWGRAYEPSEIKLIEDTVVDKWNNGALGTYIIVDPWQNTPQAHDQ